MDPLVSISVRVSREALPTVPKPTRESNFLMLVFTVLVVVEDFLEIPVAQVAKGVSSAKNCWLKRILPYSSIGEDYLKGIARLSRRLPLP